MARSNTFAHSLVAIDLDDLASVHVAELDYGSVVYVKSAERTFMLSADPSLVPNGTDVVAPVPGARAGKPGARWASLALTIAPASATAPGTESVSHWLRTNDQPFDFREFGAQPNNPNFDNGPALMAAFAAAGGREIMVSGDTYTFYTPVAYHIDPGANTFVEAPKLRGFGRDRTIFDCRAPNAPAFSFDTTLTLTPKFLRGLKFTGIGFSASIANPANAHAIKLRHCYFATIEDCLVNGFSGRGIWLLCNEGDTDGCVHVALVRTQIQLCAAWGVDLDIVGPHNELSDIRFDGVTVASCGTEDASALTTEPVSGGVRVKGQAVGGDELAITTCNEVGLLVYGGAAGLGNTFGFKLLTLENNEKRAYYCSGAVNFDHSTVQVFQNDQFRAGLGVYFDDSVNPTVNFSIHQCFFRVSSGLRVATFDHLTGLWSLVAHKFAIGDRVEVKNSGGVLPDAFAPDTTYYVIADGYGSNAFKLSLTPGGPALTGTTDGTGIQSVAWRYFAFDSAGGGQLKYPVVWLPAWSSSTGATIEGLGVRYSDNFLATVPTRLDTNVLSVPTLVLGAGLLPTAGGGVNVFFISNAAVAPTSVPVGGGILYVEAGALKYLGPAGTVTPIAPA